MYTTVKACGGLSVNVRTPASVAKFEVQIVNDAVYSLKMPNQWDCKGKFTLSTSVNAGISLAISL